MSTQTSSGPENTETIVSLSKGDRLLPEDFQPSENEVIIGRGKKVTGHSGNQRFQEVVRAELLNYSRAPSKTEKSFILAKILHQVRRWSKERTGFVKLDPKTGRWHAPRDSVARVTVAQAFRDALSNRYSSSKHNKQRKRQIAKGYVSAEDLEDEMPSSASTSCVSNDDASAERHPATGMSLKNVVHQGMLRNYNAAADTLTLAYPNQGQNTMAHIRAIVQSHNTANSGGSVWNTSTFDNTTNASNGNSSNMMMMHQPSMGMGMNMNMNMNVNMGGMNMNMGMGGMNMNMGSHQQGMSSMGMSMANRHQLLPNMNQQFQTDTFEPLPITHHDEPATPNPYSPMRLKAAVNLNEDAFFASEQTSSFFLGNGLNNAFSMH